jgi:hypothetical protein
MTQDELANIQMQEHVEHNRTLTMSATKRPEKYSNNGEAQDTSASQEPQTAYKNLSSDEPQWLHYSLKKVRGVSDASALTNRIVTTVCCIALSCHFSSTALH